MKEGSKKITSATLIIFLVVLCSWVYAQETYPHSKELKSLVLGKYNYIYDNNNCNAFQDKVKSLIEINNPDSSYKATMIMRGLCLFDTIKYSAEYFKPLLDKIIKSNTTYYENNLIGEWRFSHDFWTGMVSQITTTTAIDTGKVVKFDGHLAYFYFNDSLFRQTSYKVEVKQAGNEFTRVHYYNIHFDDQSENWSFSLSQNRYGSKMIMTIYIDPNCACGCGQYIYKKIECRTIDISKSEGTTGGNNMAILPATN